jgi:mRNA-degrading endonuclease RelE of RelBE toxin-antitoxin system
MSLKIVSLASFSKDVKKLYKRYKQIASDLKELNKELKQNPKAGVSLGSNCFKIRVANSSIPTGKSGGFRVIYYLIDKNEYIYLMAIYSKSELETISDEKIIDILKRNGLK